jgi:hypothetical protein
MEWTDIDVTTESQTGKLMRGSVIYSSAALSDAKLARWSQSGQLRY